MKPALLADARQANVDTWETLTRVHDLLLAELRRRISPHTTWARFELLGSLVRQDGQTMATLSRTLRVTAGNLTGLVVRAERDGLVQKKSDSSDKRLSRVFLTAKGRTLASRLRPTYEGHITQLMSSLRSSEKRELVRMLAELDTGVRCYVEES